MQRLAFEISSLLDNKCEATILPIYMQIPPTKKPNNTINHVNRCSSFDNFIAGFNNEKKAAASIIPAENDNIEFIKFLLTDLKKKIQPEPKTVTKKVNIPATKACVIKLRLDIKE